MNVSWLILFNCSPECPNDARMAQYISSTRPGAFQTSNNTQLS